MKWRNLALLSVAELLGMALWFSAMAIVPALSAEWALTDSGKAWLTMSVQLGFVVGTLASALFNLSDILNSRHLFSACALAGAGLNASIALFVEGLAPALVLRFLTGVCLAGVYPPGMKIAATWFKRGRGMALGALVGALTVGSASPHLLNMFRFAQWRYLMLAASACSALSGVICFLFVSDGPYLTAGAKFDWRYATSAFRDRAVRLANLGYLGHMWELYAVWTWMAIFLLSSVAARSQGQPHVWASGATFAVIAVGGAGCIVAGLLADRYGRTTITIGSMAISGVCCCTVGLFHGANPAVLLAICLVWGFAVVADSAQFSAAISELATPEYLGTALTLQTCLGFLLTLFSIRALPHAVDILTWRWAFVILGPFDNCTAASEIVFSPHDFFIAEGFRWHATN